MFVRIVILVGVAVLAWSVLVRPSGAHGPKQVVVVRAYDTLWSIASTHYAGDTRAAVYRIEQRNHLGNGVLHPGQTLVLP